MISRFLDIAGRCLASLDFRLVHASLTLAFAAAIVASFAIHQGHRTENKAYDWMVRHRFHTPAPDPDVAILDMDEKSLARLGEELGRWPWPREVLGWAMEELEKQGAKAVVFDILFSDPDKWNPVSERAFSESIATSKAGFYSVLRLNPGNDGASAIQARQLQGLVQPVPGRQPDQARTVALILPYFQTAVASGRLGTNNIYPDDDGVIRRYHLWEDVGGWRISSMPYRLAKALDWPAHSNRTMLLRWMEKPMSFKTVSFSDFYEDSQRQVKLRPRNEFKGKIVLIGSSATSMFDIKGTPLAAIHPGVDVLATAIDNAKNHRFQKMVPDWAQMLISLTLLAAMLWLSIHYPHEQLSFAFVGVPTLLLLVSYLSLNLADTYIDLSASASIALMYFTIIKVHHNIVVRYRSGKPPFARAARDEYDCEMCCLGLLFPKVVRAGRHERRLLDLVRRHAPRARIALNAEAEITWLASGSKKIFMACWTASAAEAGASISIREEANQLAAAIVACFTDEDAPKVCLIESSMPGHSTIEARDAKMRSLTAAMLDGLSK